MCPLNQTRIDQSIAQRQNEFQEIQRVSDKAHCKFTKIENKINVNKKSNSEKINKLLEKMQNIFFLISEYTSQRKLTDNEYSTLQSIGKKIAGEMNQLERMKDVD